jgi:general stress protein 26
MSTQESKSGVIKEALEFLQSQKVAVVASTSPDGEPHAAAVFYTVSDDLGFYFYFFSKDYTKKFKNLEANNRVALVIYTENPPVIVQAQGTVSAVTEGKERQEMVSKLVDISMSSDKYYDPPISKMKGGELTLLKIDVESLRFADFRQRTSSSESGPFRQVIP